MAKIYLWEPTSGLYGHCSLLLDNGTYVSYWPSEPFGQKEAMKNITVESEASTYIEDVKSEGNRNPDITINIKGKLDDWRIESWWLECQNCGYSIGRCNCFSMIVIALEKGNLEIKEYESYVVIIF